MRGVISNNAGVISSSGLIFFFRKSDSDGEALAFKASSTEKRKKKMGSGWSEVGRGGLKTD